MNWTPKKENKSKIVLVFKHKLYKPISQLVPPYPYIQRHSYNSSFVVQVPPFKHGFVSLQYSNKNKKKKGYFVIFCIKVFLIRKNTSN